MTVIPREGGVSSTRRPIDSITTVSGILDHPPSRVMTTEYDATYDATISRHELPEACIFVCPPRKQRAQGRPGACCTRGLACDLRKQNCTRAYRAARNTPAFPAQWLYGLLRALPGERLFCLRRPGEAFALPDLTPAPRRPNHTTSPYASGAYVQRALSVHRISPRVRDDGQRPSSAARRAELCD